MRLPSAGGAGGGAHCYRYAGAWYFCLPSETIVGEKGIQGRDTPPIHRRYLWWSGMLKGAVAGAPPTAPERVGGGQGSNPRRRRLPVHGAYY